MCPPFAASCSGRSNWRRSLPGVKNGVLRQTSVAEFDRLLARAVPAVPPPARAPRLIESRFRATLRGEALIGSAVLHVLHRRAAAGLLPLDPLNLAVRTAVWDDGTSALLGELAALPTAPN